MDLFSVKFSQKVKLSCIYSLSCRSKPIRLSFILETYMKIFYDEPWEVCPSTEPPLLQIFILQKVQ